jgi:hypothetical protein
LLSNAGYSRWFLESAGMSNTVTADQADLEIGAEAIARNIFDGKLTARQVYRLAAQDWPIFRIQGKLAARPSAMAAEMTRREAEALQRAKERPQQLEAK